VSELHQLVRQIAQGTSAQKRRAWLQLFDAGSFWSSCRLAVQDPSSLRELGASHELLASPWERSPLRELVEAGDEDVNATVAAACRTLAAACVAACAAGERPNLDQLVRWAALASGAAGVAPGLPADAGELRREALIRLCFRTLAANITDQRSLAAAQDAALGLLYGTRANQEQSPARRVRIPMLLARGDEGFLGWLWLERLSGGFGEVFQAPDTRFDPLRDDLRAAVETACALVRRKRPLAADEDVRWWLAGLPARKSGTTAAVSGSSLQGAAASGLTLLLEDRPYHPTFAVSTTVTPDGKLGEVGGFSGAAPKLRAALRLRSASGPATVIVSPENTPTDSTLREWNARGVRILVAATLDDAVEIIRRGSEGPGREAPVITTAPSSPALEPPATPAQPHSAPPPPPPSTPAGVLSLDNPYYVLRPTDAEFSMAIERQDSIVRIKGARQMGKTSLLARGLHQARAAGATVVLTDCQMFNAVHLESAEIFLSTMTRWFIRHLKLDTKLEDVWDSLQGPNWNFREFMLFEVLQKLNSPLVWALDEVDRLFPCEFGSEIFGLFRSWHNERALDPAVPWSRLTIAMAHASDAHLFITEPHQSPFNVGTRISLEDFTLEQVADLNVRYRSPLKTGQELEEYHRFLGGQPYLSHLGIYEMATRGLDFTTLQWSAQSQDGFFSEHMRRLSLLLAQNREMCEAVTAILAGQPCPPDAYVPLWSAGIITGGSAREARMRCELYGKYLERHLP
jgi:hypothetical protein